ncbi:hypothetical protein GRAN_3059 [Granulicella sibirica]|uniref:Uncharacterized protein n=1 Tax=Granulicella sibirica TaxID=2479048 RepID=A0A4Q0T0G2_9BACT|nr:hypothetical protein GRAN_3059 [Granulicella sibirica]
MHWQSGIPLLLVATPAAHDSSGYENKSRRPNFCELIVS